MIKKFFIFALIFLFCFMTISKVNAAPAKIVSIPVEYNTKDGMIVKGTLYVPKTDKKPSVVILLHSLGGTQKDWANLPSLLTDKGYAVMALDLRGHGQSIYTRKMQRKYWQNFSDETYKKIPDDIVRGIDNLKNYKQINSSQIGIVGCGIGATVGAIAAASRAQSVKTLVLISPSEEFRGMNVLLKIVDFGTHPILSLAGQNDRSSVAAVHKIKKVAQAENKIIIYPKAGAGLLLYKNYPTLKNEIVNWICEKL